MRPKKILLIGMLLAFTACSAPTEPGNDSTLRGFSTHALSQNLWPDPQNIPVCWELLPDQLRRILPAEDEIEAYKARIEEVVVSEYSRAGIVFTGWENCPDDPSFVGIQVMISKNDSAFSRIGHDGRSTWANLVLDYPLNCGSECLPLHTAIHEFGHAIGLHHEANRRDNRPDLTGDEACFEWNQIGLFGFPNAIHIGDYDPDSVMNYCTLDQDDRTDAKLARLSEGDIRTIRAMYFEPLVEFKYLPEAVLSTDSELSVPIIAKDHRTNQYVFQLGKADQIDCTDPTLYSKAQAIHRDLTIPAGSRPGLYKLCILGSKDNEIVQSAQSYSSILWELVPGPVLQLQSLMEDSKYLLRDHAKLKIKNNDQIKMFRYKFTDDSQECKNTDGYSDATTGPVSLNDQVRSPWQWILCGLGMNHQGTWQNPQYASFWFIWGPFENSPIRISFRSDESALPESSYLKLKAGISILLDQNDSAWYRYQVGPKDTVNCKNSSLYGDAQSLDLPITIDLSAFGETEVSLCVIGGLKLEGEQIRWQSFDSAAEETWLQRLSNVQWQKHWDALAAESCDKSVYSTACFIVNDPLAGGKSAIGSNECRARVNLVEQLTGTERLFIDPENLVCRPYIPFEIEDF